MQKNVAAGCQGIAHSYRVTGGVKMKKVIGGFLAILLLLTALLLGTKAYFFSIGYTQPLVSNEQGIRYISKVEGKQFYVLNANSQ
mgnify:CR=1 FL=1